MTKEEVDNFEKLQVQVENLYLEISALSKKSQNDALNKFKLKFVNKILSESNLLLGDKYRPFLDFGLFDENDVPTNSDVAMMLTQYLGCFEKLRGDNIDTKNGVSWFWTIDGELSNIRTMAPKKIIRK